MRHAILAVAVLLVASLFAEVGDQDSSKHTFVPRNGFVPDEKTAIAIALAVWEPIYGRSLITDQKPFTAELDTSGVWTVQGSLKAGSKGGAAVAEIMKSDGRILRVSHGQ